MRNAIHAEWTKFRTVRGWVVGMVIAVPLTVLIGLLGPAGSNLQCAGPNGESCANNTPPVGPTGVAVQDGFFFVHQSLPGDGTITARVGDFADRPEPWAKAGVLVKQGLKQGAPYVAVARTGAHGVRLQHNFTEDTAAPTGTTWVRLSRKGDTVTAATSPNGREWTDLGAVTLTGPLEVGLFVTSPDHVEVSRTFGGVSASGGSTTATATFDHVTVTGTADAWRGTDIASRGDSAAGYDERDGVFTVSGGGDIAPVVPSAGSRGRTVENALVGVFAGLIAVLVVATMSVTSEYRRGLIRVTVAATPFRGQVLAAKAVVLGAVAFVTGVVAAGLALPLVESLERAKGLFVYPVSAGVELRVVLGTGGLFAVAAVLAVAVGTVSRRGAGTVTAMVVAVVLPYLLAVASVLPPGLAEWLASVTPAAGFAVQQTTIAYPQVDAPYSMVDGYFPLSAAGGFAVLCAYAAVALAAATVLSRRRDV